MSSLTPGTRLGPYEIVGAIGAGGMGEVYQARDTKLNRVVALKTLPPAFAADADRLARFRREAQMLAALNHPNIAAIHGIEDSGSTYALVMEFVPGRTLDAVMTAPMPVAEALPIARQIATALEAAHEQGIVHRDLKPANIKITDDGTIKVLDFGLAKAITGDGSSGLVDQGMSPSVLTMTSPAMTGMGVILGTAGYMAPEQAKGKPVDRRADIWALGVVLFEMLSGRAMYRGETVTETIAHVITQPPDWTALPASTPRSVRRLLRRCLEKEPRARYQSAGDVRIDIDEALGDPVEETVTVASVSGRAPVPAWRRWLPWALAAMFFIALVVAQWPRPAPPARPQRFEVRLSAEGQLFVDENVDGAVAVVSPDATNLVYLATRARQLFLRPLDRLDATPIAGTEGAMQQFFSPDGKWIAFVSSGALKRVQLSGGAPIPIADVGEARGGAWGPDDTIVISPGLTTGLSRVPSTGGTLVPVTHLGPNERTHRWPSFLPDGRTVLFLCQLNNAAYDDGTIEAVRLDTGERTVLVRGGTHPLFTKSGHLIYTRGGTVFAVPFDPARLQVSGEPQPVLSGVIASGAGIGAGSGNGASQLSIADDGTAVYLPRLGEEQPLLRLAVLDRSGRTVYSYPERQRFRDPRFSPTADRIAVRKSEIGSDHVYILDPARGTMTKMTFDGTMSGLPIWSGDGRQLAFFSDRGQKVLQIHLIRSDGTGDIRVVSGDDATRAPHSFSPDDRLIVASELNPKSNMDVVVVSVADGRSTPFVSTSAIELFGTFSPDGKWIAYQSAEVTSNPEIFVRAYPGGGSRRQVSTGIGLQPLWTKGGREIVYSTPVAGDRVAIMAVAVQADGETLALGKPEQLFEAPIASPPTASTYHVSADGTRFVVLLDEEAAAAERMHATVVLNFFDDIRRALAAAGK
jgi:serine/threonine-protein kinase